MKQSYIQDSYPLNVVKYLPIQQEAFPIAKYGLDGHIAKRLFYKDTPELNERLQDLIKEESYRNLMGSITGNSENKEFQGESEFVALDGMLLKDKKLTSKENLEEKIKLEEKIRRRSLELEMKKEEEFIKNIVLIFKNTFKSEHKIDGNFQETSKFVPIEREPMIKEISNNSTFDIDQILRSIDEIQKLGNKN